MNNQSGFIALISVLIVSAVLLATTLSLAQFGIANRFFVLNLEQKSASKKLAEACLHLARIYTYNDPSYTLEEEQDYPIGNESCTVLTVTPDGDQTTIETSAERDGAITNYRSVIDNRNGDFLTVEEVPSI